MSKGNFEESCSILTYLELNDKNFYDVIYFSCASNLFKPRRGHTGITFLYPDKSYREEIIKTARGKGAKKVMDILKSLIIDDYLPELSDFMDKKEDIPNRLGQKIEVVSYDPKKGVQLANNAVITEHKKFVPRGDRENMAFYDLKGKIPLEGKPATFKLAKKSRGKKGGREALARKQLARHVEACYEKYLKMGSNSKGNPYLETLVSFMLWLKCKQGESKYKTCYEKILPLLGYGVEATFYIVFEPYKNSNHIVSDDIISNWQSKIMGYCLCDDPKAVYLNCMNDLSKLSVKISNDAGRREYEKSIQKACKDDLSDQGKTNRPQLPGALCKKYEQAGSLLQSWLPQCLVDHYKSETYLKAQQDEFRLIVGFKFEELSNPSDVRNNVVCFRELCDYVRKFGNFNNASSQAGLLCLSELDQSGCDPAYYYTTVFALWRSNMFFYIPRLPNDSKLYRSSPRNASENSSADIDMLAARKSQFDRITGSSQNLQAIKNALACLDKLGMNK